MSQRVTVKLILLSAVLVLSSGCAVFGPGGEEKRLAGLNSSDPQRRVKVLSQLEGRVTPRMAEPLERILREDMSLTARAMAADSLGELGLEKSVEELRLSARRDSSWVVRRRALQSLGKILGAEVEDDLRNVRNNEPHATVRAEAMNLAAQYLQGEERAGVLLLGLRDESQIVQLTAHQHLTRITGKQIPPGDLDRWQEASQGEPGPTQ